ncbi:MAG: hypothetical protein LBH45_03425 [Campylobacteraceae bacterium]|jgi:hypothetical protein|nr:hypothetical protein [Campylobacteraceae bacterium]
MKKLELKNIINIDNKSYFVSTISMKIRHKFFEKDDNIVVYETMIFEMIKDEILYAKPLYNERYNSRDEAIAEHAAIVQNPKIVFLNQKCKTNEQC